MVYSPHLTFAIIFFKQKFSSVVLTVREHVTEFLIKKEKYEKVNISGLSPIKYYNDIRTGR